MEFYRNWVPSSMEIGSWKYCTYCGESPSCVEHVVPVAYFAPSKRKGAMKGKGLVTPACEECNAMLSDRMFGSLCQRIAFVNDKLSSKYRKVLAFPDWDDSELEEVAETMAAHIRAQREEKALISKRLLWLYSTQLMEIREAATRKALALFPDNKQLRVFLSCSED